MALVLGVALAGMLLVCLALACVAVGAESEIEG